jgi:hypothetical protein
VQALSSGVTPFRGFFALLFVLLEARYVAVGEEEAVTGEGGGECELEDGFGEGNWVGHGCEVECIASRGGGLGCTSVPLRSELL